MNLPPALKRVLQCLLLFGICAPVYAAIDLDGNHLDDLWERFYGVKGLDPVADDDGDGEPNAVECLLWTNPHDASSHSKDRLSATAVQELFAFWSRQTSGVLRDTIRWAPSGKLTAAENRFIAERLADSDFDGLSDHEETLLGLDPQRAASRPDCLGGDLAFVMGQLTSGREFVLGDKKVRGDLPTPRQSARFLMHASLGATSEDIASVQAKGFEAWLDEQFHTAAGVTYKEVADHISAGMPYAIHHAWWRQVLTGDDLLRQRLAVALTEIYVISQNSVGVSWETMEYYDKLANLSYGNWRELVEMVTLHPLMGAYLSHLKNRKADVKLQRFPDENYAREVMQLFSIGLWELNPDGSHRRDAEGREIPTYDNTEITNFARVFTGLGFGGTVPDVTKFEDFVNTLPNYSAPMKVWEQEHDQAEKRLLRGTRLPAFSEKPGRTGMDDIKEALDNIFQHPNVGPFVGRLLIQRLVTSNPSPGYVHRVAMAFNDNGTGERGDLKAVVKAILLDSEARNPADNIGAGQLREPYLRYVRLARTFKARSAAGSFKIADLGTLQQINQILLNSPSVFNFFLPDFQPAGPVANAGIYAPEFQIMTSSTAITSLNLYMGMIESGFGDVGNGPETMRLNLEEELKVANDPDALIALLDLKMACGALTPATTRILHAAYRELPASYSAEQKVKAMMQLIVISPDFAVLL